MRPDASGIASRYDGHSIVRAEIRNADDLAFMQSISPDMWSDAAGVGLVDFRIPPENIRLLNESGIQYTILIPDVQTLIDAERERIREHAGGNMLLGGPWYEDYHPLNEIMDYMDSLAAQYPSLASVSTLGESIEGRPIRALHITGAGGPDRPTIVIQANQHAREWVTLPGTMYIAEQLLSGYGTDPYATTIVDNVNVHVIITVNPDGYEHTWTNYRLWRKNRRNNGGGSFGVDLNRNWETGWGGQGSSGDPNSDLYRGTAPFSEPETAAMRDFISSLPRVDAFVDYHSYGQLILQPWAWTGTLPPDHDTFEKVGADMEAAVESLYGQSYRHGPTYATLYPAGGFASDWPYDMYGTLSYTVEMRDQGRYGFVLPADQIIPAADEAYAAFLELVNAINPPCLDLLVDNLVAGQRASFRVGNLVPGGATAVLYSMNVGEFNYSNNNWCVAFGLDIPPSKLLSRIVVQGKALDNGYFVGTRRVPGNAQGFRLMFQAAEGNTCPDPCMSNIVVEIVQ